MDETIREALEGWTDFYLITGSAAAALTGLQFVVQTLIASGLPRPVAADPEVSTAAFGTPTVVHFAMSLVLSSVMAAPWPGLGSLRAVLAVLGIAALIYSLIVLRRARRQRVYTPVFEDWLWHIVLPTLSYGTVVVATFLEGDGAAGPLFAIAAATLLLVCIGIHNAWDTVTFLTTEAMRDGGGQPAPPRPSAPQSQRKRRR